MAEETWVICEYHHAAAGKLFVHLKSWGCVAPQEVVGAFRGGPALYEAKSKLERIREILDAASTTNREAEG